MWTRDKIINSIELSRKAKEVTLPAGDYIELLELGLRAFEENTTGE